MKLAFLCTSLASGRDGVGDYVRQLAVACAAAGHSSRLIALNDRLLRGDAIVTESPDVIRLPATLPWKRRISALLKYLEEFDPDWVSWQIVPYGFHRKGLMPASIQLAEIVRRWRQHVMLHELWIGIATGDSLRSRLIGTWQRRRLLQFLAGVKPSALHTSNVAYQTVLSRDGWQAELLPLFGNIPVEECHQATARAALARLTGAVAVAGSSWIGVIFGTIHPQWKPAETLLWLRHAAAASGRAVALLAIGRVGQHGQTLLARISREFSDIAVIDAGSQPPETVSRLIQAADFGIATHPWALIEKSGSTATLLEHGIPVLVPRDDWALRQDAVLSPPTDTLLKRLDDLKPDDFSGWLKLRRTPAARLTAVAAQMLIELGEPVRRCAFLA